jgi:hypothetical protein
MTPVVQHGLERWRGTVSKATTARRTALAVMTAFVASGAAIGLHAEQAQQGPQPWIHLDMTGDRANMNLNLPLAAIEAALALAPEAIVDNDGQLQLGGQREIPVVAIRAAWSQLRDAGDVEIANIQDGRQSIRVAREGDTLVVDVTGTDDEDAEHEGDADEDDAEHRDGDHDDAEHDQDADHDDAEHDRDRGAIGEVQIRVPVSVVDALLSGTGETLDVRGAIQELSALRGEMVQVIQPDGRIRVWIDESPTQ